MQFTLLQHIILWVVPLLFAITVHEVAHGWVASKLGDKTAKMLGRITLNPIKHIDLLGTIIIPIALLLLSHGRFTFGWAKPVPVNFRNLKHIRRDTILVTAAGPVSNFLMALGWAIVAKVGQVIAPGHAWLGAILLGFGSAGIAINLILGIFNLIPIPPLDGSRIVSAILPNRWAYQYNKLERWGFIILLILLVTHVIQFVMYPIFFWAIALITKLFGLL